MGCCGSDLKQNKGSQPQQHTAYGNLTSSINESSQKSRVQPEVQGTSQPNIISSRKYSVRQASGIKLENPLNLIKMESLDQDNDEEIFADFIIQQPPQNQQNNIEINESCVEVVPQKLNIISNVTDEASTSNQQNFKQVFNTKERINSIYKTKNQSSLVIINSDRQRDTLPANQDYEIVEDHFRKSVNKVKTQGQKKVESDEDFEDL